eukprot:5296873-Prymnesium_polylepis.1
MPGGLAVVALQQVALQQVALQLAARWPAGATRTRPEGGARPRMPTAGGVRACWYGAWPRRWCVVARPTARCVARPTARCVARPRRPQRAPPRVAAGGEATAGVAYSASRRASTQTQRRFDRARRAQSGRRACASRTQSLAPERTSDAPPPGSRRGGSRRRCWLRRHRRRLWRRGWRPTGRLARTSAVRSAGWRRRLRRLGRQWGSRRPICAWPAE